MKIKSNNEKDSDFKSWEQNMKASEKKLKERKKPEPKKAKPKAETKTKAVVKKAATKQKAVAKKTMTKKETKPKTAQTSLLKMIKEVDGKFKEQEATEFTFKIRVKGELTDLTVTLQKYSKKYWLLKFKEAETPKQKEKLLNTFESWLKDCYKKLPTLKRFDELEKNVKQL